MTLCGPATPIDVRTLGLVLVSRVTRRALLSVGGLGCSVSLARGGRVQRALRRGRKEEEQRRGEKVAYFEEEMRRGWLIGRVVGRAPRLEARGSAGQEVLYIRDSQRLRF